MLFSAWHATTHASHPVHRSRSTLIPQRCAMSSPLAVTFLVFFHSTRKQNQRPLITAVLHLRYLHTRGRPRERAGLRFRHSRKNAQWIRSAAAGVSCVVLMALAN